MNYPDFKTLSRERLMEHFEQERQEWLAAGMDEASIYRIHFGEADENGRGGDYRIWLNERKHTRPDRKYAPGTPVAIDAIDPEGAWISGGCGGFDDVEFDIDLKAALSQLTESQRFCFVEIVMNNRTQQSVANDLRVKQQVVDRHTKAAKKKLQIFFMGASRSAGRGRIVEAAVGIGKALAYIAIAALIKQIPFVEWGPMPMIIRAVLIVLQQAIKKMSEQF